MYYALSKSIGTAQAGHLVGPAAAALTIGFALWMAYRAWRSPAPDRFALAAMLTLAFYLLVTVLFFWPWYTIWLIALVPLVRDRQLRTLAILFSFASLSRDFVVYPMFNWKPPFLPHPWLELWQAVGIMAIPWLYSLYLIIIRQFKVTWLPGLPGAAHASKGAGFTGIWSKRDRSKQPARIQKKPRKN